MKGFARHARGGARSTDRASRPRPAARPRAALAASAAVEAIESRWLFSAAFDVTGLTALREDPRFVDVDGSDVAVAVLDTGVFGTHPDLQQNLVGWYNAVTSPIDTPAASISHTGQQPEASNWLLHEQWLILVFARPSRTISSASK